MKIRFKLTFHWQAGRGAAEHEVWTSTPSRSVLSRLRLLRERRGELSQRLQLKNTPQDKQISLSSNYEQSKREEKKKMRGGENKRRDKRRAASRVTSPAR